MGGERLEQADAASLIAQRLREAAAATPAPQGPLSPAAVAAWEAGEIARIERGSDLVHLPIASHRGAGAGQAVVALKRALRRLAHPLPAVQSDVNAATAATVSFLLEQLAAQARAIERLEAELAALRREQRP